MALFLLVAAITTMTIGCGSDTTSGKTGKTGPTGATPTEKGKTTP